MFLFQAGAKLTNITFLTSKTYISDKSLIFPFSGIQCNTKVTYWNKQINILSINKWNFQLSKNPRERPTEKEMPLLLKNEYGWFTENNIALQAVFLLMYELCYLQKKIILGISAPALAEFALPYWSLNKMQWEVRRGMMTEQYFIVTAQPCHSSVAGTGDMTTFITHGEFFTTTSTQTITAHPAASLQAHVLRDSMDLTLFSSATCKVQTLQRFSCETSLPWADLICSIAKD